MWVDIFIRFFYFAAIFASGWRPLRCALTPIFALAFKSARKPCMSGTPFITRYPDNFRPGHATNISGGFGPDNSDSAPNPSTDKYTAFGFSDPAPFFTDSTNFRYVRLKNSGGTVVSQLAAGESGTFDVYYSATAVGTTHRAITVNSPDQSDFQNNLVDAVVVIAATNTITVPGTADPYLAGMPDNWSVKGDTAPAQSPVLVQLQDIAPGDSLVFNAKGQTDFNGGATDPNADLADGSGFYGEGADDAISGCNYPLNALVGVFLDDNTPVPVSPDPRPTPTPPASLDFTSNNAGGSAYQAVPGGTDYTTLEPQLRQLFFIGNGRTSGGTPQHVVVPRGRLACISVAPTDPGGITTPAPLA